MFMHMRWYRWTLATCLSLEPKLKPGCNTEEKPWQWLTPASKEGSSAFFNKTWQPSEQEPHGSQSKPVQTGCCQDEAQSWPLVDLFLHFNTRDHNQRWRLNMLMTYVMHEEAWSSDVQLSAKSASPCYDFNAGAKLFLSVL